MPWSARHLAAYSHWVWSMMAFVSAALPPVRAGWPAMGLPKDLPTMAGATHSGGQRVAGNEKRRGSGRGRGTVSAAACADRRPFGHSTASAHPACRGPPSQSRVTPNSQNLGLKALCGHHWGSRSDQAPLAKAGRQHTQRGSASAQAASFTGRQRSWDSAPYVTWTTRPITVSGSKRN